MAKLYYAKVNINSNIFDVYEKKITIPDIMKMIFDQLDDKREYNKKEVNTFPDDQGETKTIEREETYNFSELNKVENNNEKYITGRLVKRTPTFGEEFDSVSRTSKKVVHKNNSISTLFYFDLETEIITFYSRQKLGYNQFMEAFENLLDICVDKIGFKVMLIKDPFSIKDRMKMLHKVNRIKSTIIPPNVNEEEIRALLEPKLQGMKHANITRETRILESHKRNEKGIDLNSSEVKETLELNEAYSVFGYSKLEVDGESKDGTSLVYDSDENSPYQTTIPDSTKENLEGFIVYVKRGIDALLAKRTIDNLKKEVED
ncbi:hypothetical protein [Bacillus velezensis]|uniref:hypothetical protein n=1 Tax=Bacillus velezensis TaxID=492670 RepID=UPI0020424ED1|nr:hypothetical protein [Bacillus velezensis]MCM3448149.1 hypothetical protein [Bacillus velezensis]MEC2313141.1 hypothetical protein [Bacillus velezensis]